MKPRDRLAPTLEARGRQSTFRKRDVRVLLETMIAVLVLNSRLRVRPLRSATCRLNSCVEMPGAPIT